MMLLTLSLCSLRTSSWLLTWIALIANPSTCSWACLQTQHVGSFLTTSRTRRISHLSGFRLRAVTARTTSNQMISARVWANWSLNPAKRSTLWSRLAASPKFHWLIPTQVALWKRQRTFSSLGSTSTPFLQVKLRTLTLKNLTRPTDTWPSKQLWTSFRMLCKIPAIAMVLRKWALALSLLTIFASHSCLRDMILTRMTCWRRRISYAFTELNLMRVLRLSGLICRPITTATSFRKKFVENTHTQMICRSLIVKLNCQEVWLQTILSS